MPTWWISNCAAWHVTRKLHFEAGDLVFCTIANGWCNLVGAWFWGKCKNCPGYFGFQDWSCGIRKSSRGILEVPSGNDSNGSLLPPGHACSHWQCITCELHPQNSSLAPSAEVFACEQAPLRCAKHMWSIPCFWNFVPPSWCLQSA